MRKAISAAMLLGLALTAPMAKADVFLADFQGFDWTWPTNNCLDCANHYYEAQGFIQSVNPAYLNFNFVANEYTFTLGEDLFFTSADTFGTIVVAHYVNGRIKFYGDDRGTGTPGTYNFAGDCDHDFDRLRFADGTLELAGDFTNFDIIFDTTTGDGNLQALTDWTGGAQLGNIPVGQRTGWTFGAIGIHAGVTPCGYNWQIDGDCYLQDPLPVQPATWGQIKTLILPNGRVNIQR